MNLSPNVLKSLASIALVLAAGAAIVGSPRKTSRVSIDIAELSRIVENEEDHVDALELADWIKQGKTDLQIIDLRTAGGYDSLHIPNAVRSSIQQASSIATKNQTVVLYSEGGVHSAQAWFMLKALGYPRVYFLKGGMAEWEYDVLFPQLNERTLSKEEIQKRVELAKFFGGEATTTKTDGKNVRPTQAKKKPVPATPSAIPQPQRDPTREVC